MIRYVRLRRSDDTSKTKPSRTYSTELTDEERGFLDLLAQVVVSQAMQEEE